MRSPWLIAVAIAAAGCTSCKDKKRSEPFAPVEGSAAGAPGSARPVETKTPSPEIKGTLSLAGAPLPTTDCRPGKGFGTYVEVITPSGKLRFEEKNLYWIDEPTAALRGDRLACTKLDRSWGGGQRIDGTAYWRGLLDFDCTWKGSVALVGKLELDCGNITAEERASLDKNRAAMKAEQAAAGSGSGSAMASQEQCVQLLSHLVDLEFAKAALKESADEIERLKTAAIGAKSDEFLATCTKTPASRVTCALAATDLDGIAKCDEP